MSEFMHPPRHTGDPRTDARALLRLVAQLPGADAHRWHETEDDVEVHCSRCRLTVRTNPRRELMFFTVDNWWEDKLPACI